jgi:hypothetical protein
MHEEKSRRKPLYLNKAVQGFLKRKGKEIKEQATSPCNLD